MRDLIDYVVRSLVERPDEVHIEEHTDGDVPLFELSVHPDDRGRVIGRNGQTIRAVRSCGGGRGGASRRRGGCRRHRLTASSSDAPSRPRGLRGELVIRGGAGRPRAPRDGDRGLRLSGRESADEAVVWREVKRVSPIKDGVVIEVAGIGDRDEAERWRDADVVIDPKALPAPVTERFHWSQVDGFAVETLDGDQIGAVSGHLPSAAHDILKVDDGEVERLIPAVDAVIVSIDIEGGRIVIDPIPGLLDLNT